jgi:hypothetical protein
MGSGMKFLGSGMKVCSAILHLGLVSRRREMLIMLRN